MARKHLGMFGANFQERLAVEPAIECSHGIGAAEGKGVRLGEFIPKLFEANGGLDFALLPQKGDHFAERENPRKICLGGCGGPLNHRAHNFGKARGAWPVIDHEFRQRLGGVKREITPVAREARNVKSQRLEAFRDGMPMRRGGKNDD